jgi:hypothetical protein
MKRLNCSLKQIEQRIQSMPKKSRFLTRAEIRLRIEVLANLYTPNKNALRG